MLEVEMKFRLEDIDAFRNRLGELPLERLPTEQHVDTYYRHPVRDFAATDEALRCRVVNDAAWITYKGPRLDETTKSREELELPFAAADAATFALIAERLGFHPVREVHKTREPYRLATNSDDLLISLDHVPALGWFCELETLVESPNDFAVAKKRILSLADRLGLQNTERKSYLCLLLEQTEKN